jgi:hypothetical protein
MKMKFGLEGRYRIVVRGPDMKIKQDLLFPNLILNNGLNGIGTNGGAWHAVFCLGTGTSTPADTDVGLSGTIVSTGTLLSNTENVVTGQYGTHTIARRFAQGAATGTWTEVGVGKATNNLWSRALILDGLSLPTSLVITSIDIVDIVYELRCYLNPTDATGTRTIGGVSTSYVMRPRSAMSPARMWNGDWMSTTCIAGYGADIFTGALNASYTEPSSIWTSQQMASASTAAYVNGSYTKVATHNYDISGGNAPGGIAGIGPYANGDGWNGGVKPFKCSFSPPIAKLNTQTLALSFSYVWSRRP